MREFDPETIARWREMQWQSRVEDRNRPREPPPRLRCPKCFFRTLQLWKCYGETYLKCEHCGHEVML